MKPPFRADQVGSLLRPRELAESRAQWKKGALKKEALQEIENQAIRDVVRKQEAVGLQGVTDGEFRRDWWHLDFLSQLEGVTLKALSGPKHMRPGRAGISREAYPDLDGFWADAAAAYRAAIAAFADAGCTYLQLDDTAFAYLCDPKMREACRR